jgi:glutamyl-tRNA synthetase
LLAWWHVRSRGGRLLLRIEDLDTVRARSDVIETTLRDLRWLGLDWDGEPLLQSNGVARMQLAIEELLTRGAAYPCICSRADVRAAQTAPQLGDVEPRYPGTCRGRFASVALAERVSGRPAGIRFVVNDEDVAIVDGFAKPASFNPAREVGDFLIARRDGAPAYQLAVVLDDAAQGVTEVLRGDDLLPSSARQWQLQKALGKRHPAWFHVPLVLDESGQRLAKRRGDISLAELRAGGTDPRAIVAWAARTAGQVGAGERLAAADLLNLFDLKSVPQVPVRLTSRDIAELRLAR